MPPILLVPPGGAAISWSVTGSYSIIGSTTSTTVKVQRTASGSGVLTASLDNVCNIYTTTKNLLPLSLTITPGGNGYCGEAGVSTNLASGNNFIWQVTGDLQINLSGQTLNTTDNSIGITGTEGDIILKVLAFGDTITLSQHHKPYDPQFTFGVNPMYGSDPLALTLTNISDNDVAYVDWYIDNNFLTSELSLSMYENDPPCGNHTLKAIVYLECGSSVTIETAFEVYCSWFRTLVIYPNPAKSMISIAPDTQKSKKEPMQGEYDATLYDRMGKQVSTKRSDKQVISIDIQQLPNDTYFLHLRKPGEKEMLKRQIIVQH